MSWKDKQQLKLDGSAPEILKVERKDNQRSLFAPDINNTVLPSDKWPTVDSLGTGKLDIGGENIGIIDKKKS